MCMRWNLDLKKFLGHDSLLRFLTVRIRAVWLGPSGASPGTDRLFSWPWFFLRDPTRSPGESAAWIRQSHQQDLPLEGVCLCSLPIMTHTSFEGGWKISASTSLGLQTFLRVPGLRLAESDERRRWNWKLAIDFVGGGKSRALYFGCGSHWCCYLFGHYSL